MRPISLTIIISIVPLTGIFVPDEGLETRTGTYAEVNDEYVDFHRLFSHERSIRIEGTEDHPVFEVTSLAVEEEMIAVLDATGPQLTLFSDEGEMLFEVGEEGRGPGDFVDPRWIGFDNKGRVAVMESTANPRFQFFSTDQGEHVGGITEDVTVGNKHAFFEGEEDDQQVVFATRAPCPDGDGVLCVIQRHDVSTGAMLDRFAAQEEIESDIVGLPWILGRDDEGYFYVTHNNGGPVVAIFSPEGERVQRFPLDEAPDIETLNYAAMPEDDLEAVFEHLQTTPYSRFFSIHPVDNDIILEHEWHGGEDDGARYLSVFDPEGNFKTSTDEIDYELHHRSGDRVFFVENVDPEADLGAYVVHEYRYEGVGE